MRRARPLAQENEQATTQHKEGKKKTHVLVQAQLHEPGFQGRVFHIQAHGGHSLVESAAAGVIGDVGPQGGELG
jgi:hypothetical protein